MEQGPAIGPGSSGWVRQLTVLAAILVVTLALVAWLGPRFDGGSGQRPSSVPVAPPSP